MRVYRVRADVNRFQYLVAGDKHAYGSGDLRLDGRARLPDWQPPRVTAYPPHLAEGHFWKLGQGGLAVAPDALELLRPLLEPAAELLPVHFRGQPFVLLNLRPLVDCLDPATEWFERQGRRLHVRRYVFDPARLPAATLFKTPEEAGSRIYAIEGRGPAATAFKAEVERRGLTGLVFEPVWEAP